MNYLEKGVQHHLSIRKGDVGRYVLLPGNLKRCEKTTAYFDDAALVADSREYVTYTGYLDGEKVSVTSTGIGGPSAFIATEEPVKSRADTFIRVGICGGMGLDIRGGDIVVSTGVIRMEGTSKEYAPIEYSAATDLGVSHVLMKAAKRLGQTYHAGMVECKDTFYGQHEPKTKPVNYKLTNKWEAWLGLDCRTSEIESVALFVVTNYLRIRCGSNFLVVANQEKEKAGLDNPVVHDTGAAIKVTMEALRVLIQGDKAK